MSNFDDSIFDGLGTETAQGAEFANWHSFGKLALGRKFKVWNAAAGTMDEISAEQAKTAQRPISELIVGVDVAEFRPESKYEYERSIGVGSADWRKSFLPALAAALNIPLATILPTSTKDKAAVAATDAKLKQVMAGLRGKYVEVVDVEMLPRKNDKHRRKLETDEGIERTGEPYTVPVIVTVFDSRESAHAAYLARFTGTGATNTTQANGATAARVPAGWTDEIAKLGLYPDAQAYADAIKGIVEAAGGVQVDNAFVENQSGLWSLPIPSIEAALAEAGLLAQTA